MKPKYKIGDVVNLYQDYNTRKKTVVGTICHIEKCSNSTFLYFFEEYSESRFEDEIESMVRQKINEKA